MKLRPYSLISIRQNYNFDRLATIWHEIASWFLTIYQDLPVLAIIKLFCTSKQRKRPKEVKSRYVTIESKPFWSFQTCKVWKSGYWMPGISLSRMGSHFSFLENRYDIKNEFPNFDETFIFLSKYFFPTWIFVYFIQGVTAWVLKIHTPVLYYLE